MLSGLRYQDVKFVIRKNAEKRQQKPGTCFARLPQNELKIDVARFTSHESSLANNNSVVGESREKFYFLNLCVLRVLPAKENLFGSKWLSALYGITPAKFVQLVVSINPFCNKLICCKAGLNMGIKKRATSLSRPSAVMFQNKLPVLSWFYMRTRITVVFSRISIVFKLRIVPRELKDNAYTK